MASDAHGDGTSSRLLLTHPRSDRAEGLRGVIAQRIDALSPKQRVVAELLLEDPYLVAYTPASEVASHLGVDNATVVRATQSLGFEGWRDLQRIVRESLQSGLLFADRLASGRDADLEAALISMRDQMVATVSAAFEPAQLQAVGSAVGLLLESERTFVVGGGTTAGSAHFTASSLNLVGHGAQTLLDAETASVVIPSVAFGSAVVVFALRRYLRWIVEFAAFSREQGASLIAVVDSHSSPIALSADVSIVVPAKRLGARLDTLGHQTIAHAIPAALGWQLARRAVDAQDAASISDRFTHSAAMIHHHPGKEN
jgi:DNA-binding MurR/RpiR family transcriptional regulator